MALAADEGMIIQMASAYLGAQAVIVLLGLPTSSSVSSAFFCTMPGEQEHVSAAIIAVVSALGLI